MFVPHDDAKPFSIMVSKTVVRTIAGFTVLFMAVAVFFLFTMGRIGLQLQLVSQLKQENQQLTEENERLVLALARVRKTEQLGKYLRRLALLSTSHADAEQIRETILKLRDKPLADLAPQLASDSAATEENIEDTSPHQVALYGTIPTISPVDGWITKEFEATGGRGTGAHTGIDFAAAEGTPIRATAPGVVFSVENHRYFGLLVVIDHGLGYKTHYGHCSQILVKKGEAVERGQTIALVGNTGRSTAPHLHYEIIKDERPVDPAAYILTTNLE